MVVFFAISDELGTGANYPALFMVNEFLDVFPDELPGLQLDQEIKFNTDLILRAQPVSIPPYKMAPVKLTELRK